MVQGKAGAAARARRIPPVFFGVDIDNHAPAQVTVTC